MLFVMLRFCLYGILFVGFLLQSMPYATADVISASSHSIAVRADGTLLAWGGLQRCCCCSRARGNVAVWFRNDRTVWIDTAI